MSNKKEICLKKIANLFSSMKHIGKMVGSGWGSSSDDKQYDLLSAELEKEKNKLSNM